MYLEETRRLMETLGRDVLTGDSAFFSRMRKHRILELEKWHASMADATLRSRANALWDEKKRSEAASLYLQLNQPSKTDVARARYGSKQAD